MLAGKVTVPVKEIMLSNRKAVFARGLLKALHFMLGFYKFSKQ